MSHEPVGPLVMVVDDEPQNLQVLGALLRQAGYRVAVAHDGATALARCLATPPDVVLLDVGMPGIDGFAVCRALKQDVRTRGTPVLFVTARTDEESLLAGFAAGGADYVTKPIRPLELLARVGVHASLRRLKGLLTVCAHCARIRSPEKGWERLDHYVARHTEASVSHGLCEDCLQAHFPEFA
jgi:CheY-like chemotaxis protein